jgi:hypothetical protein
MGNSNSIKPNYYSVEYLEDNSKQLSIDCHTMLTQKSRNVLVKRSKSYAVPENQVLPREYISSKPLKQLNKFKTDGLKKTWKREPNLTIKNKLVTKSSFNLYNYKINSKGIINSKSVENILKSCETNVSDEDIFDSIEQTNMFEQQNTSSSQSISDTCTNSTLLSFNNNFNFQKSNIFPISVRYDNLIIQNKILYINIVFCFLIIIIIIETSN